MSRVLMTILMLVCLSTLVAGCSGGGNEPMTGPPLEDPGELAESAAVPH